MGSAEECALVKTLYCGCVCESTGSAGLGRGACPPFMDGNLVGRRRFDERCQCRKLSYVSTTVPVCVQVYCPTCLGSEVRNRQLVVLNCPTRTGLSYVSRKQGAELTVGGTKLSYAYGSVTSVYALLNVGSGLLSKRDKVRTGLCGNVRNCGVPLPQTAKTPPRTRSAATGGPCREG